ncbi:MAG: oligosaccharide flippase family protein [Anaerolineales bacterium]|nr:oligosaccharide flippase family protein [Anaerolineales bacterium]
MISSLRRNSFWLLFARLTAQALAILFIAITARRLGLNDFGHFAFIASILLVGNTFTNFGTDTFLVRDIARAGRVTELASQSLFSQLILSTGFCIAIIFYRDLPLFLYILALFPLALYSVDNALLRALNRMDLFWLLSLANGIVQVIAAYFSSDVFTLCLFLLIGQIFLSAFSLLICRASLPDFSLLPLKDFRPIFKLILPFAALTILLVLIQRLGILSVSTFLGDSATGIFSSAVRVVDGLKFGHYAILGALLPALSRGSPDSWQSFRKAFLLLMMASLTFAIALVIFANPIVIVLYGKEFLPVVKQLSLLGWSLLPYTISSFISYSLIARGLELTLVKATAISLLVYVVLYLWLINSNGLSGAIWTALFGECLQAVIFVLFYFHNYSIVVEYRDRT